MVSPQVGNIFLLEKKWFYSPSGMRFEEDTNKTYKTPYADISVERHVYQSSAGGKVYVPLEDRARIVQGATPRFGKLLSHKYTNLAAPGVIEDLSDNHARKISIDYLQKVTDHIGSIAQAPSRLMPIQATDLSRSGTSYSQDSSVA